MGYWHIISNNISTLLYLSALKRVKDGRERNSESKYDRGLRESMQIRVEAGTNMDTSIQLCQQIDFMQFL